MNSSPSLRDLQRGFLTAIFSGDGDGFGHNLVSDHFPGTRRLQVYHNNTFTSLSEALRDIYPVVNRLVGDGFFNFAANDYITEHPSRSGNLHDFGERFPAFLAAFPPAGEHRYLPDVARLEWAWHRAFHAADHGCLDLSKLAAVPPRHYGALQFALHPSAALLHSRFPVLRVWEVNQEGFVGEPRVDLDDGAQWLLVWRPELEVLIRPLEPGQHALLEALADCRPFSQACESALAVQAGLDVSANMKHYVSDAVLVDFGNF